MLVLGVVILRSVGPWGGSSGSGPSSGDGCPTGRPLALVTTFTSELVAPPAPSDPRAARVYRLEVDFEVTNRASAPIVVQTIEVGVVGVPDARVVATGGTGIEVGADETTTVQGSGDVYVVGRQGAVPPSPESHVSMSATWADEDRFSGCRPARLPPVGSR